MVVPPSLIGSPWFGYILGGEGGESENSRAACKPAPSTLHLTDAQSPLSRSTLSGVFGGSPPEPSTITLLARSRAWVSGLFLVPLTFYASATAHSLLLQGVFSSTGCCLVQGPFKWLPADTPAAGPLQDPPWATQH